jgi:hypothetical protein
MKEQNNESKKIRNRKNKNEKIFNKMSVPLYENDEDKKLYEKLLKIKNKYKISLADAVKHFIQKGEVIIHVDQAKKVEIERNNLLRNIGRNINSIARLSNYLVAHQQEVSKILNNELIYAFIQTIIEGNLILNKLKKQYAELGKTARKNMYLEKIHNIQEKEIDKKLNNKGIYDKKNNIFKEEVI